MNLFYNTDIYVMVEQQISKLRNEYQMDKVITTLL